MAHFSLAPGQIASAVTHRTVEEIWFVLTGSGEIWRKFADREEVTQLQPGLCLTIPLGTHFQFRACAQDSLAVVAVTLPPWPGEAEAVHVQGPWVPSAA